MKIILFNASGDTVMAETNIVEEAEKILREYESKRCGIVDRVGNDVLPLSIPLPDEVFIIWPMSGGQK